MAFKPTVGDEVGYVLVDLYINTSYDIVKVVSVNMGSVVTVATDIVNVNTVADDINAGKIDAVIEAVAIIDQFDNTYLGPKAVEPVLDNKGNPLTEGDLYFDTNSKKFRVYTGTEWQQIVGESTSEVFEYTATADQTVFTGADDNALVLSYTPGFINIGVNGSWLHPTEYTASNGSSITMPAVAVDSQVQILAFGTFDVANLNNALIEASTLNDPTLTGIPLAPTATANNNSQQIATTEYVETAVANIVYVLNKVDAVIPPTSNDDANDGYSESSLWLDIAADEAYRCLDATVGAAIWIKTTVDLAEIAAIYAPLVSPIFTGTPELPTDAIGVTQAIGNSSQKLATTEFVKNSTDAHTFKINPQYYNLGDGSDGTVEPASNPTLANGEYNFINYTLNSGLIMHPVSATNAYFVFRCTGKFTLKGTIDLFGHGAAGGISVLNQGGSLNDGNPGGMGGGGGGGGADDNLKAGDGGSATHHRETSAGGIGHATFGAGSNGQSVDAAKAKLLEQYPFDERFYGGGGGGAGTTNDGLTADGGNGGGVVIIIADEIEITASGDINCIGEAGEGGGAYAAAGGGGAGGFILLVARVITNNGFLDVIGASGGVGVVGRDGGDGGNGQIIVITR